MRKFLLTFLLFIFLGGGFVLWQGLEFWYSSPNGEPDEVVFEVRPGTSFRRIAGELEDNGIVTSAKKFSLLGRVTGYATKVRTGEYALQRSMRPIEVLEVISSGKSISYSFTVPEGTNIYEIAQSLDDRGLASGDEFLSLCQNKPLIRELLREDLPSLEGYLYPETYSLTKFTKLETLVRMMVENFLQVYDEVKKPDLGLTRHQVVTLASVVEKETGVPAERPVISSVFHNRLKKKMRLQSDPTILYGIAVETGKMPNNITKKDIHRYTKYNTYTVNALPFGPISNPGREALAAVFRPDNSEYLYFVSRNDGTHVFTETYKDHTNMVRKFQMNPAMRKGKSWRDRLKK